MTQKIYSTFQTSAFTHALVEAIHTSDAEAFAELLANAQDDCPRPATRIDPHFVMLLDIGINKLLNPKSVQLILKELSTAPISDLTKMAALLMTGSHLSEAEFEQWFGESSKLKPNLAVAAEENKTHGSALLLHAFQYGVVHKQDTNILKRKLDAVLAVTQDVALIHSISDEIMRLQMTPAVFLATLKAAPDAFKEQFREHVDLKHLQSKYLPEFLAEGFMPQSRMLLSCISFAFRENDKQSFIRLLDLTAHDAVKDIMVESEMTLERTMRATTPEQIEMLKIFKIAFDAHAKRLFQEMKDERDLGLCAKILLRTFQKKDEDTFKELLSNTAGKDIPDLALVLSNVFHRIVFEHRHRKNIDPAEKAMLDNLKSCAEKLVNEQHQKLMALPEKTAAENAVVGRNPSDIHPSMHGMMFD